MARRQNPKIERILKRTSSLKLVNLGLSLRKHLAFAKKKIVQKATTFKNNHYLCTIDKR